MSTEDRSQLLSTAWARALELAIAFVLGMAAAWAITLTASQPRGDPIRLQPPPTPPPLAVHVACAVATPGVYYLPPGSRVRDAVAAAGGALDEANLNALNLAAPVEDGQQICVPFRSSAASSSSSSETSSAPNATSVSTGTQININTADAAQLEALPGIGPALAQRIIEYRQEHGPFATVEDLIQVPGIGPAKLEQLRPWITTGSP